MNKQTLAFFFWLALFLSSPLEAVVMIPLSLADLTARADAVVRGVVLSKECQRDASGRIYTKVELKVSEVWKGQLPSERLTVVHGGGVLGRERVEIAGQVEYKAGEEVVTFVVFNQRHEAVTLGLAQGKFHVWKDSGSNTLLVRNPFHGSATVSPSKETENNPTPELLAAGRNTNSKIQQRLTLAELRDQVKGAAK
ncbi:MAG: hypothetical protein FJ403_06875 [Verrucomicrobia bacterium]|nr:hypothetical protein [Verrucomicrobiota bacterium]